MGRTTFPGDGQQKPVTIFYDDIRALQFFLKTDIVEDEYGGVSNGRKNIPGHQRRRGPSDKNPINVLQSEAEYLIDPSLKSGNARPGIPFRLQTTSDADIDETRQFTYTGRFIDLHSVLNADIAYHCYLYPANGGRHTIGPDGDNEG